VKSYVAKIDMVCMGEIKVGTCGYGFYRPPEGRKSGFKSKLQSYSHEFQVCELNRTFYRLPAVKTAERWREEARKGFEFTLKAWQAITHPTSSPTWRRAGVKLSPEQERNYGMLRPTKENFEAWDRTREVAEALEARICVVQCPARFGCTDENVENMRRFFSEIDRGGLLIAWEPRGDWNDNPERIRGLCDELGLIHVVDPMRRDPLSEHPVAYLRLHGLNPREFDYRYDYSRDELEELARKLGELARKHREVYCLFNNFEMYKNARELMEILRSR